MNLYDYFIDSISNFFDWQKALPYYYEVPLWFLEFGCVVYLITRTTGGRR